MTHSDSVVLWILTEVCALEHSANDSRLVLQSIAIKYCCLSAFCMIYLGFHYDGFGFPGSCYIQCLWGWYPVFIILWAVDGLAAWSVLYWSRFLPSSYVPCSCDSFLCLFVVWLKGKELRGGIPERSGINAWGEPPLLFFYRSCWTTLYWILFSFIPYALCWSTQCSAGLSLFPVYHPPQGVIKLSHLCQKIGLWQIRTSIQFICSSVCWLSLVGLQGIRQSLAR